MEYLTPPPYLADPSGLILSNCLHIDNPSLRVAVHPGEHGYAQNNLFDSSWIINSGWCEAMVQLRELAFAQNIEIGTSDFVPLNVADVIIFINIPSSCEIVREARRANPLARLILIASESPVVKPHQHCKQNHLLFDAVLTYYPQLQGSKYLRLPPGCAYRPDRKPRDVPFSDRRFCVMVNSNVNISIHRLPRPWQFRSAARAVRRGGWCLPLIREWQVLLGSRYHCRRSFARAVEHLGIDGFDLYGQGWDALQSGWVYRVFPEHPWQHWRGVLKQDKLSTLCNYKFAFCYENYSGDEGYISEKIFDSLAAGSIPLCLGDRKLKQWIPSDCAVFRDDYSSDLELLKDISRWSEDRWYSYRDAGQAFLHSERVTPFLPATFAQVVLDGIKAVAD